MTVPPLPGLWSNDVAIHPEALGLTLAEMRDLVESLSLPLKETQVSESSVRRAFDRPDYLLASSPTRMGETAVPVEETAADEVSADEVDVERARVAADDFHDEEGSD